MKTKSVLYALYRVVSQEAELNPDFDARLREVLRLDGESQGVRVVSRGASTLRRSSRDKAVLDPVATVRERGEDELRKQLATLTVEQLKDIISEYSMDQDKLAMKWKSFQRLTDRIVEISHSRSRKGDAFRD